MRVVLSENIRVEYELIRTSRQNILIKVLPRGATKVYAPKAASVREVDAFVRQKAHWIKETHERLDADYQNRKMPEIGSMLMLEGTPRRLTVKKGSRKLTIQPDELILYVPEPNNAASIPDALRFELANYSITRFRERLDYYAPLIGVRFGRVTVREQKTRWGSCSSKSNLNFNWKLIMAPSQALDYVVIHELCHLIVFNHSEKFWQLVKTYMPEYEAWKKWLNDHGKELTLAKYEE